MARGSSRFTSATALGRISKPHHSNLVCWALLVATLIACGEAATRHAAPTYGSSLMSQERIRFPNQTRAGPFEREVSSYLHNKLSELLLDVHGLLTGHGIAYWAMEGTLLGAYRHAAPLPWDKDLDIGLMANDFSLATKVHISLLPF